MSVKNIEVLGSLALILLCAPWRAGKNVEWSRAGLEQFILGATSLVILKYGSYNENRLCIFSVTYSYFLVRAVPEKKNMGVFDGTFILPPPSIRFNYCLGPSTMRSNYQSTPQPT